MTDLTKEIKETTENKLNCKWQDGEKTALKGLWSQLENLKDLKDPLKQNIDTLGNQILPEKNKSLKDFLEQDIKGKLVDIRAKRDKKSEESKTVEAANIFVQEVANELQTICWNNSDIVMALQIYVNGLNDLQWEHATIPYDAKRYNYKADTKNRLFIDGFLGPHTYNALWLAIFKEELPQIKKDVVWYIKEDGTVYLPGKDGKYNPILIEKQKYIIEGWDKELPSHFQKLNLFLEFYEIYKDWALKVANSRNKLNSKRWVDEWAAIKLQINNIDKEIENIIIKANNWELNNFDHIYDIIFAKMNHIEKNIETVLWQDDLEKMQKLFTNFDATKYKELELDMLNINRRKFGDAMLDSIWGDWGWNSDAVKSKLMERILERSDFEEINKLIQDPKTMSDIVNNKKDNLSDKLKNIGLNQESIDSIIKEILKKYAKISSKNAEERPQYTALIEAEAKDENDKKLLIEGRNQQHSEKIENQDWDDYLTKATDFMIKESTNTSTLLLLQELMIEGKIKSLFDANNDFSKDKDLAMMKDILGVGTWDISDNNLDYAIEAWQTIALAAVTMGAWAIAAKVALAAVKYWSTAIKATKRGARIVSWADKLSKGGKIAKWMYKSAQITKWGLKTWVEWFAFYEGSNLMTNVLLPDRELFENVRDRKEIAKSAAFVWVLKWLWTAFSKLNLGGNANTLINTNGLRIWAPKALVGKDILQNFGKILVQGWMLTGTSQWLEFVFSGFDEDGFNTEAWNPTWEEFIQACLLSRMAEGAGKLPKKVTFKKRGKTIELVDGGKWKDKVNKPKKEIKNSEEISSLKRDKRSYLEKQREINGKIKEIRDIKSYKEKLTNDVQKINEQSKWIKTEVEALKRRIANHKDQIKLLEDPAYKNKNGGHISELEAKKLIESNKTDIAALEKQLTPKKEILEKFDKQIKSITDKIETINNKQKIVNEEISALDRRIVTHKDQIKLLEDPNYKAANAISESQAKDLIQKNNKSITELETQLQNKKSDLLKIEQEFVNQDIKNLRLNRLQQAKHIDNINVILKNEIITKGGKEFTTKPEAENFLKRNASLLKKWAIITLIAWGSLVAYKTVKWAETETPNIIETNPVNLSDEELVDSVTINNNNQFIPTIEPIEE